MKAPIVVTGATGFVGRRLVGQLLADGARVRVVVRTPARLPDAVRGQVEVVVGDLRDDRLFEHAFDGAGIVLHLAALATAWSPDPSAFTEINERAVERMLEAARRRGVERIVHVSTVLTLPTRTNGGAAGTTPYDSKTPYERSKRAGERLVEAYAREGGDAVIVHPTRVYGPGPLTDANGVSRMIDLYLRGRFRVRIADGGVRANYVHVDDVARGIRLAATRGDSGAHYVLGGRENVSLAAFLALVDSLAGRRRWMLSIPPGLARRVGHAGEIWGRATGETSLTRGWIDVFLRDLPCDVAATRRALGYAPRPLRRGVRQTMDWLASREEVA